MDIVNLTLDFKSGPKSTQLLVSSNTACFRRLSDIHHFKWLLETWLNLNQGITELQYLDQLKASLPNSAHLKTNLEFSSPLRRPDLSPRRPTSTRTPNNRSKSPKVLIPIKGMNSVNIDSIRRAQYYNPKTPTKLQSSDRKSKSPRNVSSSKKKSQKPQVPLKSFDSGDGRGNFVIQMRPEQETSNPKARLDQGGRVETYLDVSNNIHYTGETFNGMAHGHGKMYFPTGVLEYEGTFKCNLLNGKGILYNEMGNLLYQGEFVNGIKEGKFLLGSKMNFRKRNRILPYRYQDVRRQLDGRHLERLRPIFQCYGGLEIRGSFHRRPRLSARPKKSRPRPPHPQQR
jgi:hypothetical protein